MSAMFLILDQCFSSAFPRPLSELRGGGQKGATCPTSLAEHSWAFVHHLTAAPHVSP